MDKRISLVVFLWFHGREQKDLLDVVGVGKEHGQTVNTHTPTTGWWQTVFKSLAEVFVNDLSLFVTSILILGLLCESLALIERIIQFSVSIADFLGSNEQFETFTETRAVTVNLGERRHHHRVAHDESG